MNPVSLASLPNKIRSSAEDGMKTAIRSELNRLTPGKPMSWGIGVAVGTFIYLKASDAARKRRIEEKLDEVLEAVE